MTKHKSPPNTGTSVLTPAPTHDFSRRAGESGRETVFGVNFKIKDRETRHLFADFGQIWHIHIPGKLFSRSFEWTSFRKKHHLSSHVPTGKTLQLCASFCFMRINVDAPQKWENLAIIRNQSQFIQDIFESSAPCVSDFTQNQWLSQVYVIFVPIFISFFSPVQCPKQQFSSCCASNRKIL